MNSFKKFLSIMIIINVAVLSVVGNNPDSLTINEMINELNNEIKYSNVQYQNKIKTIFFDLRAVDLLLKSKPVSADVKIDLLIRKIDLKEKLEVEEEVQELNLSRIRYKKGLDLIRMLYEKILGLDHHFSTLQTYQDVMSLSNPHTYPEFKKTEELIKKRLKKDHPVELPALLNSNPYISSTFFLVASLIGTGDKKKREKDLDEISCIIDFTARMNGQFSTIYYETEYLKDSNRSLKEECITLFADYTKVLGYRIPLNECRKTDDWDVVYDSLEELISGLEKGITEESMSVDKLNKQIINLEFSVDRLLSFIDKYNAFISQGIKYYQKFQTIVSSYPNEETCSNKISLQFNDLKKDIKYSIAKFDEAYNIAELKGSKLKDLLYGYTE